ncbi:serine hydrolase domain-containing protein [Phytomonospora sp. NPDC050363]|uniref:serine hydrolase domain-containing protein n=1 Tax=Phytomonospora sp. NPDC050363 TaxID=3155642 RepID=UPI0034089880
MTVNGTTAPGFEAVADAFAANFSVHGELGAAFTAYRDGELVADLWGGAADRDTGRAWTPDTLQLIFSGAKGLTTACVLLLAERGALDLDAPVARYWPEFAAAGKSRITVREVLSHQARLPGVGEPHDYADWLDHATMAGLLAAQAPVDDPRAGFAYHAVTFGWLTGELVLRVDGRSIGTFFAEEFAAPLGLDVFMGLPDEHHHRASIMVGAPGVLADVPADESDPLLVLTRNILVGSEGPGIWNDPAFRRTEQAAIGVHASARGMARFYACLARGGELDGVRVLKESTVEAGRREVRRGIEPTWNGPMVYGTGFELQNESLRFGAPVDAFGHAGWGGSRHAAWPEQRIGYSYVMNEIRTAVPDRRPLDLLDALYKSAA